ncbi:hypothetical protein ACRE_036730 [Hapsidospora chrysogenum ATCC 11550]|uniref:Uncharacterized protein n=1 Tax=Hapsidospora chrysogenum (strain ATCC 11550 / CBS 779.69 / DSM 880 / IAM 14645 / JCM 23072 / IMI 49137) TaxID=857340 RepID=A0A086T827_HAPC1|nr:hypothetical protein ACRE_036730 [Hapsidospora chrysogenum ATCC 11550]
MPMRHAPALEPMSPRPAHASPAAGPQGLPGQARLSLHRTAPGPHARLHLPPQGRRSLTISTTIITILTNPAPSLVHVDTGTIARCSATRHDGPVA